MKTPILIVGFVSLLLILALGATLLTIGSMFSLGTFLLPQHPATIVIILSGALAIMGWKANRGFHGYAMRRLKEKGVPELPESERMAIQFWTRATLFTVFLLMQAIILVTFHHHG